MKQHIFEPRRSAGAIVIVVVIVIVIVVVVVIVIVYYTTLHYTTLYYTILYYTILYYTILYYTILYGPQRSRNHICCLVSLVTVNTFWYRFCSIFFVFLKQENLRRHAVIVGRSCRAVDFRNFIVFFWAETLAH